MVKLKNKINGIQVHDLGNVGLEIVVKELNKNIMINKIRDRVGISCYLSKITVLFISCIFLSIPSIAFATVDTFYPSLDGVVGFDDGGGGSPWATARNDAGDVVDYTDDQSDECGFPSGCASLRASLDDWAQLSRFIFKFDTSSIPDNAIIDSVTFSVYGHGEHLDNFNNSLNLYSAVTASDVSLIAGDYALANYGTTELANDLDVTAWDDNAYNEFTLNSDGYNEIDLSGITTLAMRFSGDVTNTEPTFSAYPAGIATNLYFSERTGTSEDPILVVTYHTPASSASSASSVSSVGNSSSAAAALITGSGSMDIGYSACSAFIPSGSGSLCSLWEHKVYVDALEWQVELYRDVAFYASIIILFGFILALIIRAMCVWLFKLITSKI